MSKTRKIAVILLAAVLMLGISAQASFVPLSGSVVSTGAQSVRAPFGGSVENMKYRAGDLISVGDAVATIGTTLVYAPQDGTIGSVCAQVGDSADGIIKHYGGVLFIEPVNRYTVSASTEKAYNSSETKYIHIGEKVYLSCTQDGTHNGTAQVIKVEASDDTGSTKYSLEVTSGKFYIGETVNIFRSADYDSTTRIGRGTVGQNLAVAVEGSGSILKMHVKQGDYVERGQLLFETVDGVLDGLYAQDNTIYSDIGGIIASVEAQNGADVAKNGKLLTVYPLSSLQIEAKVYLMDLGTVEVGDAVEIEFDVDTDSMKRYPGMIESVSYLSQGEGSQKYYNAYISFEADEFVRLGLPATVYQAIDDSDEDGDLAAQPRFTEPDEDETPGDEED